jgi:TetR/AcrR family transcriptional regulator, transcriptional repressor for nem operon
MGRNKEFDKALVLHKAMEVFGHYGYEGTSLQNLTDGLGIGRQSLYDTYGSKRDLFLAAVKHYVNEKTEAVVTHLERSSSVKQAITDIFHQVAAVLKDEARCKECFIMHSAIDQIPHDPEIAAFFHKDVARLEEAFHKALVRAREQGELTAEEAVLRAKARYLNHARYSMTQVVKITSDPQVLDDIVTVTLSTLEC